MEIEQIIINEDTISQFPHIRPTSISKNTPASKILRNDDKDCELTITQLHNGLVIAPSYDPSVTQSIHAIFIMAEDINKKNVKSISISDNHKLTIKQLIINVFSHSSSGMQTLYTYQDDKDNITFNGQS